MQEVCNEIAKRIQRARDMAEQTENKTTKLYNCELCKDTEFIFETGADGYEYAKPCRCRERNHSLRLLQYSGISEEDAKKGFTQFETFNEEGLIAAKKAAAEYYKAFREIKDSRNNSLLLCGASGRGKTTLGMAVANNLINVCEAVTYMPYREEITQLKQEITDEQTYREHMRRLKNTNVLFIDDLLKGKVTDSDLNIIYEIVNARYLAKRPMIISTEKTPAELIDYDEAIGGRIMEMCKGYVVIFDKSIPNYRMR